MGVNSLKMMMPRVSELAGLHNCYTNHSLRATAATRLFASGIPEKVIAEFTGHKSSKTLQVYEQTTGEQVKKAELAISNQEESMLAAKVPDKEPHVQPDLYKVKSFSILTLAGRKAFSKLDLCHVYPKIPLAIVKAHKVLYCYLRQPFRASSTPAMFQ